MNAPLSFGYPRSPAPKGWEWGLLSKVCQLESGHTPSRRHPEYWGGEIDWISITDVDDDTMYIQSTAERVTPLGIENSSARILPAGTVLLSRGPTIGKVCILPRKMATNQSFVAWVPKGVVDPEFLYYLLRSSRDVLLEKGSGATMHTIYMPDLEDMYICYPPDIDHQRDLADQASKCFEMISKARTAASLQLDYINSLPKSFLRTQFYLG